MAVKTLDEYQRCVERTMPCWPPPYRKIVIATLGLGVAGEAGEVADLVKKWLGHGHALDLDKLEKELGDVLWYVAALAKANGLSLKKVAQANVKKLQKRYPDGFSSEASINRKD